MLQQTHFAYDRFGGGRYEGRFEGGDRSGRGKLTIHEDDGEWIIMQVAPHVAQPFFGSSSVHACDV